MALSKILHLLRDTERYVRAFNSITSKFPKLKVHGNHAGALMRHMLDTVLSDFDHFLPNDVLASLLGLLNHELAE